MCLVAEKGEENVMGVNIGVFLFSALFLLLELVIIGLALCVPNAALFNFVLELVLT